MQVLDTQIWEHWVVYVYVHTFIPYIMYMHNYLLNQYVISLADHDICMYSYKIHTSFAIYVHIRITQG